MDNNKKYEGRIEIIFGEDNACIVIDGTINTVNATATLGSIMGILLRGDSEDAVKEALQLFTYAFVTKYKE